MGSIRNYWLEKITSGLLIFICVRSLGCFTNTNSLFVLASDPKGRVGQRSASIYGKMSSSPRAEPQRTNDLEKRSGDEHAWPVSVLEESDLFLNIREKRDTSNTSASENKSSINTDEMHFEADSSPVGEITSLPGSTASQTTPFATKSSTEIETPSESPTPTETTTVVRAAPTPALLEQCPNITISVNETNDNKTEISWTSDSESEDALNIYLIQIVSLQNAECKNHTLLPIDERTTSIPVAKLCYCNQYSISVSIECNDTTQKTKTITHATYTKAPDPPVGLKIKDVTNQTMTLEWSPPGVVKSPITSYTVYWKRTDTTDEDYKSRKTNITYLRLENLEPYTDYTLKVSAWTCEGEGAPIQEVTKKTTDGIPDPPKDLQFLDVTNETLTLKWSPPTRVKGVITNFTVYWKKTGVADENYKSATTSNPSTTMRIKDLAPYTTYAVKVSAWTSAGQGNASEEVTNQTKEGIPDSPENLEISDSTNQTLTLQWSPPAVIKSVITNYTVYCKRSESTNEHYSPVGTVEATKLEVQNLMPYRNYTLKVSAWTIAGEGNTSQVITSPTKEGIPDHPEDLHISEITNRTMTLQWSPPKIKKGVITNYTIYLKTADSSDEHQTIDGTGLAPKFELRELTPYTLYALKVSAWTSVGEGTPSPEVTQRTHEGIPEAPADLHIPEITNQTMTLQWSPPKVKNGVITNYTVYLKTAGSTDERHIIDGTAEAPKFELRGLMPYTLYTLKVSAWTSVGEGKHSQEITRRTHEGIPEPPESFTVTISSNETLTLEWSPPSIEKGIIVNYTMYWKKTDSTVEAFQSKKIGPVKTLLLEKLTPYTNYTLKVSAWTSIGEGKATQAGIWQTKEGIPSVPRDVDVNASSTSIYIKWKVPETPNGIIKNYTVFCETVDPPKSNNYTTEDTEYRILNLDFYTAYNVSVSARTSPGEGSRSEWKSVRTDVGEPTAPQNVTVEGTSDISISLRWENPLFPRGPIDGFYVLWRKTPDEMDNTTQIESNDNYTMSVISNSEYLISDLDPWTNYTIEIKAYNKHVTQNMEGPSESIIQATKAAVPDQPRHIAISEVTSSSVSLAWNYEGIFPGPLRYKVEAELESDPCNAKDAKTVTVWERVSNPKINWRSRRAVIGDMKPYTSYRIRVCASTDAGDSASCGSAHQRTKPTAPGKPTDVRVDCNDHPTAATVQWRTPSVQNGLIEKYEIKYGPKGSTSNYRKRERNVESQTCSERVHKLTLVDLHPEINYEIFVRAKAKEVSDYGAEERYHQDCVLPAGIPPFPKNDSLPEIKGTNEQVAYFSISRTAFSSEMGEIRYYAIIVGFLPADEILPKKGNKSEAEDKLPVWSTFWKQNSKIYQATPEKWNPFKENFYDPLDCQPEPDAEDLVYCTVGLEKNCSEEEEMYCNGPLKPGKRYGIKLRGFTNGGFSDTNPVIFETASVQKRDTSALIGGLVFLFLLISVLVLAIIIDKQRNFKAYKSIRKILKKKDVPTPEQNADIELNRIAASAKEEKDRPMNFTTFLDHVKIMMSDSFLRFSLEYEEIKQNSPKHPCTAAEMEENRYKNRWMNIFPFDHSRVKLLPIDDEPSSDYINANYIPGFTSHREYIATQGPLPNTVDDFWRMVWEQGVTMIVMLTQCMERGKKKCEQYWPSDSENTYYGDLKVQLKSESILSTYSIRIFSLQLGSRQHLVKQMHFTKWPDFGSPERPEDLINFVQAVRDHLPHTNTGPLLVHCSAGVGRTGTFIAVDRLLQHIEYHNDINIYKTVVEMREHRTNMVQTEDQYIYIHKCMRDTISQRLKPRTSLYSTDDLDEDLYSNINMNTHQATEL